MNIDECTTDDVQTIGDDSTPTCIRFVPNTPPEAQSVASTMSSQTGVSTKCALSRLSSKTTNQENAFHWYALRATYGRELKAYNYLLSKGTMAFCPTINVVKEINGRRKTVTESRLPNIFFAYGTEEQIKEFVYDNVNLPFLRFYYRYVRTNRKSEKEPLIIPDSQIKSLKIICEAEANDIIMSSTTIAKFEVGQLVRVIDGAFRGVVGRVARYQGQQRVAVVVNDLFTACTAYVPKAFIELV